MNSNARVRTHRTSDRGIVLFAKGQRRAPTEAEQRLWARLRRKAIGGFRFRRQHPIGTYITDFYCNEANLAIELDGGIHDDPEQRQRDRIRDAALSDHGVRMLRFSNEEISQDIDAVICRIEDALARR